MNKHEATLIVLFCMRPSRFWFVSLKRLRINTPPRFGNRKTEQHCCKLFSYRKACVYAMIYLFYVFVFYYPRRLHSRRRGYSVQSRLHIISKPVGENQKWRVCFVKFARWRHRWWSLPSPTASCIWTVNTDLSWTRTWNMYTWFQSDCTPLFFLTPCDSAEHQRWIYGAWSLHPRQDALHLAPHCWWSGAGSVMHTELLISVGPVRPAAVWPGWLMAIARQYSSVGGWVCVWVTCHVTPHSRSAWHQPIPYLDSLACMRASYRINCSLNSVVRDYYPHMPIGKVWIYRLRFVSLFFFCSFVFVILYGYGFLRRG